MTRRFRLSLPAAARWRWSRYTEVFWLGLLLCSCGCSTPLTKEECNQLLDRYVELLIAADRPGTSAEELHRMKRETRSKAAHDPAFHECSREVSRRKFECAMQAQTADKLEQCML